MTSIAFNNVVTGQVLDRVCAYSSFDTASNLSAVSRDLSLAVNDYFLFETAFLLDPNNRPAMSLLMEKAIDYVKIDEVDDQDPLKVKARTNVQQRLMVLTGFLSYNKYKNNIDFQSDFYSFMRGRSLTGVMSYYSTKTAHKYWISDIIDQLRVREWHKGYVVELLEKFLIDSIPNEQRTCAFVWNRSIIGDNSYKCDLYRRDIALLLLRSGKIENGQKWLTFGFESILTEIVSQNDTEMLEAFLSSVDALASESVQNAHREALQNGYGVIASMLEPWL